MSQKTQTSRAKFSIGELVHHRLFDYRGVIVDVDQNFQATDTWYRQMARSRPPKNKPWYHVLVHESDHSTYVAEQNLTADNNLQPINHPRLAQYFSSFIGGKYARNHRVN